jgi:hypothetical protein
VQVRLVPYSESRLGTLQIHVMTPCRRRRRCRPRLRRRRRLPRRLVTNCCIDLIGPVSNIPMKRILSPILIAMCISSRTIAIIRTVPGF